MRPGDRTSTMPASEINPMVQTPLGLVNPSLEGAGCKTRKQLLLHFRAAIPISIGQKHNIRGARRDDSARCRANAIYRRQMIRKHHRLVHETIAVDILQKLDRARISVSSVSEYYGRHAIGEETSQFL